MKIVFDIGASKMRLAKSNDGKTIQTTAVAETPRNFSVGFSKFIAQAEALTNGEKIEKIAGGIAGLVNNDELTASANLNGWANQKFAEKLSAYFKCPVRLENDAAAGALGEAIFGAGKGFSSVIYITLGTGIGGAWVVDGKLQNEEGTFEPGHQFVDAESKKDLEDTIRTAGSQAEKEHALAAGLHNALMFWPAEIVVLGGGKILHDQWSLENIKTEMTKLTPAYTYNFKIVKTELKDEAGLYGALHLLH